MALRIGIEWVDLEVYRLVVGLKDVAGLGKTSFVKFFGSHSWCMEESNQRSNAAVLFFARLIINQSTRNQ